MLRYLFGIIVVLAILGFSLNALYNYDKQDRAALLMVSTGDHVRLKIAEDDFPIITVVNPIDRERGLSRMTSLGDAAGMLFVFDTSDYYSFWMKEMNFSIDIIWLDEAFKVVDIKKNIAPETYPETFVSRGRALYVFEARAGFADFYRLSKGSVMNFYIQK